MSVCVFQVLKCLPALILLLSSQDPRFLAGLQIPSVPSFFAALIWHLLSIVCVYILYLFTYLLAKINN